MQAVCEVLCAATLMRLRQFNNRRPTASRSRNNNY